MCYQDTAAPIRLRSHPPTPDLDRNAHVTTGISVPLLSRTRLFLLPLLLLDCSVIHSLPTPAPPPPSPSDLCHRQLLPPSHQQQLSCQDYHQGFPSNMACVLKGKCHAETITRVHLLCKIAPNTFVIFIITILISKSS